MSRWTAEGLWSIRELMESMNDPPCVMDDYVPDEPRWICSDDEELAAFTEFWIRWH